jgi:hypothetical protein
MDTRQMISAYLLSTTQALNLLRQHGHFGPFLIVIYSTMDTLGLLNAPPGQLQATSSTFRTWVERYLLPRARDPYTALDLWSARCAVLHAHSTESNLTRKGDAKQIHYYSGDRHHPQNIEFVSRTAQLQGGGHMAINLTDLGTSLIEAMSAQVSPLMSACDTCAWTAERVANLLQKFESI